MSHQVAIDTSPPEARSMGILDRSHFRRSVNVLGVKVPPTKAGMVLKAEPMHGAIINLPRIRSVVDSTSPGSDVKMVLLRVRDTAELPVTVKEYLSSQGLELTTHTLELTYDYWTADDILQAVLPKDLCEGSPVGFTVTGHIAHMNLNSEYLPYKHLIGQVILDKNPRLRTVVNKTDTIDTKFRVFKMELIAGVPEYVVQHHESDSQFTFDFTQVYWNSRLHTEHDRLVRLFRPEDVIADVFAGVGPFAIPAGKKGCGVFANDLNPNSYKYLQQNIVDNRVTHLVRASCEDGREFIRKVVGWSFTDPMLPYSGPPRSRNQIQKEDKRRQQQRPEQGVSYPPRRRIAHFVMNLPESAITFLDAFRGLLAPGADEDDLRALYDEMPMVHCHCFTRELDPEGAERDIRQRVGEQIGQELCEGDEVSLHFVRKVAPNKDMYCISFRLPRKVAFGERASAELS
ncbi:Met-10+ like-protein-domain-containing protein [Amylostereum chailletii]|nr:Met-10+ like-protein-domain-containing protein [Amylostereum chailletii]